MRTASRSLGLFAVLGGSLAFSCSAGGGSGGGIIGSSGGNGAAAGTTVGPGAGGGAGVTIPNGMAGIEIPVDIKACGNGKLDEGEVCDDANDYTGDGCNAVCQIEADYECPTPGTLCTLIARCGDSQLASTELCDDGNNVSNDGCTGDCLAVEPGWQCRVPGRACVPFCGDGILLSAAGEQCDDGNVNNDDGCSANCLIEPGSTCEGTPSRCTKSVCGNNIQEKDESCDLGADRNGLFYGNGQGCSKTCTIEPNCRPDGCTTTACTTSCGDGNHDVEEGCDDGNKFDGDGCSAACQIEAGFTCSDQPFSDETNCTEGSGKCLILPVIYRDFEGQNVTGGHPDFFYMGEGGTVCVPNAGGDSVEGDWSPGDSCLNSDEVSRCEGIAQELLDCEGKPQLGTQMCPCIFTDWDETGILGSCPTSDGDTTECTPEVAGAQDCWIEQDGDHILRIETEVSVVQSAESFAQWFRPSEHSTEILGALELEKSGTLYQFSSSGGDTVVDDIAERRDLVSGFFPLEEAAGSKICNLWPYWKNWSGCQGTQWDSENNEPANDIEGVERNFYFTTEARYLFRYDAAATPTLAFYGDDDVWVFINGRRALDLGAPHERLEGSVRIQGSDYNLENGRIYEIVVFHADRHPRESNYQLTISGFQTLKTICQPRCGDGVRTGAEECDLGDGVNNDTIYGGCTTQCKYGPYCGDGVPNAPEEQCDNGVANGNGYGRDVCTRACKFAHYCGDGFVDIAYGEECDFGPANGTDICTADCKIVLK